MPTGRPSFESHLANQPAMKPAQGNGVQSPMEAASLTPATKGTPTVGSLITQAKSAQDTLGTVGEQLNTPNLKFKRAQSHLLRNKLTDASNYSRAAAEKLGLDTDPIQMPTDGGPVGRFLAYVNDGQEQFLAIQKKLNELSKDPEHINPATMMFLQSKMGLAQQEIEYSSTLLGKVISSITTIMGIQL
jgi:hypothetical protein